ncbi:MAG: heparan-alpha-glucosaminide N-acetyltransferase domain-containing protein [Planctomycetota bacterium]|nr:heparan-alpha-glucosaminide N-acetyltransferase domain-containing protein [Planctomycetota bacterium]
MKPEGRIETLDAARGLAVIGMVWTHFVATEGGRNVFERAAAWAARAVYGHEAALFFVLAGMSWAMQSARGDRVGRRALVLGAFGFAFGRWVWPTEVLVPLALSMPIVVCLARPGRGAALLAAVVGILVAMPVADVFFGEYAWSDWSDDGTEHLAESTLGWVTLRYYLLTGNYPLIGWLALPLCGAIAVRWGVVTAARRTVWPAAVACGVAAVGYALPLAADTGVAWVDEHAHWFAATWVPTTIPFALREIGSALGIVFLFLRTGFVPVVLARHGRASLTHYVAHIAIVFTALRACWPDEDWSVTVGVAAFLGYWLFAHWFQARWFARRRRGPVEASWDRVAGRDGGPQRS